VHSQASPGQGRSGPPVRLDSRGRYRRGLTGTARRGASAEQSGLPSRLYDGRITTQARLAGRTSGHGGFSVTIAKATSGRRLSGTADDMGGLLLALDVLSFIESGKVTLSGTYDNSRPHHPLNGKVELVGFRVRNAPVMAQLLQAMTLHGLV
jgi:hypothetical protein